MRGVACKTGPAEAVRLGLPLWLICSITQKTGTGSRAQNGQLGKVCQGVPAPQEHLQLLMSLSSLNGGSHPQLLPISQEPHHSSVLGTESCPELCCGSSPQHEGRSRVHHATWTRTATYLPRPSLSPHQPQSSDATTGLSSPAQQTHVGPEAPGGQGTRLLLAPALGLEDVWFARGIDVKHCAHINSFPCTVVL